MNLKEAENEIKVFKNAIGNKIFSENQSHYFELKMDSSVMIIAFKTMLTFP